MKRYVELHSYNGITLRALMRRLVQLSDESVSWHRWLPKPFGNDVPPDLSIIDASVMSPGTVIDIANICKGLEVAVWGSRCAVVGLPMLPLEFSSDDLRRVASGQHLHQEDEDAEGLARAMNFDTTLISTK